MRRLAPARRQGLASRTIVVALLAAWVAGCGSSNASVAPSQSGEPSAPGASASASASAAAQASGSAVASIAPGAFRNPVIDADFPDPFILADGSSYYAYGTTDVGQNLQLARSDDMVAWQMLDDPLPTLPGWSSGDTWAPEVRKTSAGYSLYYTAHDPDLKRPDSNGSQCITVAVSQSPEGPFVDSSDKPLVCQEDLGGSIDATSFVDVDGTAWLIWKNDGNCCGLPTRFFMQRLSESGLQLTGEVTDLGVVNDEPWEGALIEAPTLAVQDGTYFLFFSANGYDTEFYAVGYATAKKVTGPYVDAPENPILASPAESADAARARGPGHQSIVVDDDGELWLAYHAWDKDAIGYGNFGKRAVWLDRLTLSGGKATVAGPTGDPQPVP